MRLVVLLAALALTLPGAAAAGIVVGSGTTFDDTVVAWSPPSTQPEQTVQTPYYTAQLATDRLGHEYGVWSDGHHVWETHSTDGGATWSPPDRVDVGPGTAILPVVVAGGPGRVAVAYYKTPYENGDADASTFPVSAVWWVSVAENTSALGTHVFSESRATSAVHYGAGPTLPLGLAIAPTSGLAVVTYPSDQFDPAASGTPSQCNAATANSGACLHTMQALQTSGPRLSPPVVRARAARKHRRR